MDEIERNEFSLLNKYSEYLLSQNFNQTETLLKKITKTINGYVIFRFRSKKTWAIKININENITEIKRSV